MSDQTNPDGPERNGGEIDWDDTNTNMAPRDLRWHRQYSKTFALFGENLQKLMDHPAFEDGEDLKDYVETISTLMSFRPHTRDDIEKDVYYELYGAERVAADMAAASKYPPDNKED